MSRDLLPTAAAAVSRHEGTPAACRHGTRNGDDFARLLKGLFPKERSPSPLSGDEQASKLPEKEPQNCSTEQQQIFLGTEMISEPGAPPDTKQLGVVLQLFEQVPADPIRRGCRRASSAKLDSLQKSLQPSWRGCSCLQGKPQPERV